MEELKKHEDDQHFGKIYKSLKGWWPECPKAKRLIKLIQNDFEIQIVLIGYKENILYLEKCSASFGTRAGQQNSQLFWLFENIKPLGPLSLES